MPFPTTLTTGQLAQLRQRHHAAKQFLLLTPNTVVWQTQPAAQVDGSIPYASFVWDGTDDGDRADVKIGMTVLVSTSTDYRTTTIFRGRIRLLPDATTFYINETSVNLETTYYVTVIDDYDVHERLERRLSDGTRYIDWDKVFEPLPPVISGLQSVYVDTSAAGTVSLSFAPTATPFAAGASNDSYLWDVADGTITAGSSTSKDITVSFPGAATNEHRWVYFEATDSNGTTQYFVFEVYTIDPAETSSTVIHLGTGDVNINASRSDGWNATVRAWQGVNTVLDRTRCAVVSIDDYDGVRAMAFTSGGTTEIEVGDTIEGATSGATANVIAVDLDSGTWAGGDAAGTLWVRDQVGIFEAENLDVGEDSNLATIAGNSVNPPITQNVSMIGRLRNENNVTRGDAVSAQLQDTTLAIEGFVTQLGHVIGPGLYLITDTAASEWGEVTTMTVGRALVYMMTHYSTFLSLCSLTLPSDINDYEWFEYSIPPSAMLPWITSVSDDINAYLLFAPSGECTIQRHASYAGVSGLDTVLTLAVDSSGNSDMAELVLFNDYIATRAAAIIGAATYNTTLERAIIYQGRAPSQVYGPGWETDPINQQIMKSDLSETNAAAEAGSRVSAHLAYVNPKPQMQVRLPSGYYWITPSDHILYAFNIAASENTRGRAYTSSDKWLCTAINYRYNAADGYYESPLATFERVTSGGNYGINVTQVIDVTDVTPPDLPPDGAGLGPPDPIVNYPVENPDLPLPGDGGNPLNPGVPVGCDQLNVSMRTGNVVATSNNSVNGETYIVTVEGQGTVGSIGVTQGAIDFDFTNGTENWYAGEREANGDILANYVAGQYWEQQSSIISNDRWYKIELRYTFTAPITLSQITATYDYQSGGQFDGTYSYGDAILWINESTTTVLFSDTTPPANANGNDRTIQWTAAAGMEIDFETGDIVQIDLWAKRCFDGCSVSGFAHLTAVQFVPLLSDGKGDAFYVGYQDDGEGELYSSSHGLLFNGSKPGTIPLYSANHKYTFTVTGTGAPLTFEFGDSDYSDNSNKNLLVTVCGANMALNAL